MTLFPINLLPKSLQNFSFLYKILMETMPFNVSSNALERPGVEAY